MAWYYVDAGQQAGPLDEELFVSLISRGIITPETLVWQEGMANWVPYGELSRKQTSPSEPGVAQAPGPGRQPDASAGHVCCECGRTFAPDQVIRHGDKWICANCKPIFLQRIREGVTLGAAGPRIGISAAELLTRDYQVDVGKCITNSWEIFKRDPGNMIGMSLLGYLPIIVASVVTSMILAALHLQLLNFLVLFFSVPMMAGLWLFYVKKVRGEDAAVEHIFAGFGSKYPQILLAGLIPGLLSFALSGCLSFFAATWRFGGRPSSLSAEMAFGFVIVTLILAVAVIYLSTCWRFAVPLVIDKGMKFWPALELSRRIVSKHWWMNFALLFACGLLGAVGVCALCLGLLVTGPVAFGAVAVQYEEIFGDLMPDQS